jgi:hypothetical protein
MSLNLDYDGPFIPTVMATEPPGPLLPGRGSPHGS